MLSNNSIEVIILCGGVGSRLNQGLFPKPLTLINGIPLIQRMLTPLISAASTYKEKKGTPIRVTFVVNNHLRKYNFEETTRKFLRNQNSLGSHYVLGSIECNFWYLQFDTRGALETLYLYLKETSLDERQVIVLDNDNLYITDEYLDATGCGLIIADYNSSLTHFSFVKLDTHSSRVIAIEEKKKLTSNTDKQSSVKICLGYYLNGIALRLNDIRDILYHDTTTSEYYMSCLYKKLIDDGLYIHSIQIKASTIGTVQDIYESTDVLRQQNDTLKPSAVFDIDNTLITTDGEAIKESVDFLLYLKSKGWKIILSTARGMKHTNNQPVTESTKIRVLNDLKRNNILYDELHFNKPYGDIYIDDKAFNPYDDSFYEKLGFFGINTQLKSQSDISGRNILIRSSYKTITKHSSNKLDGEINFYRIISRTHLAPYFPSLRETGLSPLLSEYLVLDYITGPTLSNLVCEGLLSENIVSKLLTFVDELHASDAIDNEIVTATDLSEFYLDKFYKRREVIRSVLSDEALILHDEMFSSIESFITAYSKVCSETLVNIVHGDLWFRNILLSKGSFQFIDMRGLIGKKITVKGDKMYDYAKIYQSLVGMDLILSNDSELSVLSDIRRVFESRYSTHLATIKQLTRYTIYCSLPSWDTIYYYKLLRLVKSIIVT